MYKFREESKNAPKGRFFESGYEKTAMVMMTIQLMHASPKDNPVVYEVRPPSDKIPIMASIIKTNGHMICVLFIMSIFIIE